MRVLRPGRWWPLPKFGRRARGGGAGAVVACALRGEGAGLRLDYVRVERTTGAARLVQHGGGPLAQLAKTAAPAFAGATRVLMLDAGQRQMLVLEQPEVPEAELRDALRWPVAAALDLPAEGVLFDATPLPALNDGGKRQVLVAAAPLASVQPLVDALEAVGLRPDAIDVADMAQRNAVLLQPQAQGKAAQLVLGVSGGELLVGLVAAGELCVARDLPLPAGAAGLREDDGTLAEWLALQVQRTVDLFERQITRFAIGGVFATAGDFSPATLDALRQVVPGGLREIGWADVAVHDATAAPSAADATGLRLAALAALRGAPPPAQPAVEPAVAAA